MDKYKILIVDDEQGIGNCSFTGGRTADFRRTDLASLCMPLDGSIYFRHSWIWYTLLLDMS